jgi:hypothetical protein
MRKHEDCVEVRIDDDSRGCNHEVSPDPSRFQCEFVVANRCVAMTEKCIKMSANGLNHIYK